MCDQFHVPGVLSLWNEPQYLLARRLGKCQSQPGQLNFMTLSDDGNFHVKNCQLLWGYYEKCHISLPVTSSGKSLDHYMLSWWAHQRSSCGHCIVPASALWYNALPDKTHLQILTKDDEVTTNWNYELHSSLLSYDNRCTQLPALFHIVLIPWCFRLYAVWVTSKNSCPSLNKWCHSNTMFKTCAALPYLIWQSLTEFDVNLLLEVIHFPTSKPSKHCTLLCELSCLLF